MGTLTQVDLSFGSTVYGTVRVENQDAAAATVSGGLKANIVVGGTGAPAPLVATTTLSPEYTFSFNAATYDSTTDYSGTSGHTYSNVSQTATAPLTYTLLADLNAFKGASTFYIPISATGGSHAAGGGNLAYLFTTKAALTASLTYTYTAPAVPEPASYVMVAGALAALAFALRRRTPPAA